MRYLFFLLSILYSFIFYVFYTFSLWKNIFLQNTEVSKDILNLSIFDSIIFSNSETLVLQSFFWNLLYEIIFFFLVAISLFIFFSKVENESPSWPKIKEKKEKKLDFWSIFSYVNIIIILKKSSYYLWFFFFYLSLFLISEGLEIFNFSFFILFLNIIIFIFFFLSKHSEFSQKFLKINSICFSLFYLINYVFIIITWENTFDTIDFINGILILWIFPILLYYDKILHKRSYLDFALLSHYSIYIFWFIVFYLSQLTVWENLVFWITLVLALLWAVWFEVLPKISLFQKNLVHLRYIGIIFTYLWIFFWIIYFFHWFSYILLFILIWQVVYNFFIHKNYTNYISFVFSLFTLYYLIFIIIFHFEIFSFASSGFSLFLLFLSFIWIGITYGISFQHTLDKYIIHIFSHLINILGVWVFLYVNSFAILYIWLILLLESMYFFLSYYKLNSK